MIAHTHRRARKIARHLLDVEYGVRRTDKDIAPSLPEYSRPLSSALSTASEARCNHVHLQPHGVGILQHLDIVDDQDVLVEIAGTDLCTLCKFTFLDALLKVLLFLSINTLF